MSLWSPSSCSQSADALSEEPACHSTRRVTAAIAAASCGIKAEEEEGTKQVNSSVIRMGKV